MVKRAVELEGTVTVSSQSLGRSHIHLDYMDHTDLFARRASME